MNHTGVVLSRNRRAQARAGGFVRPEVSAVATVRRRDLDAEFAAWLAMVKDSQQPAAKLDAALMAMGL